MSKHFLIIGNNNAITYKEIFPYIKNNQLWLGMNWVKEFIQPNKEIKKFGNICWFTNVENKKRNRPLDLYCKYDPNKYPKYNNYNAIEVSKTCEIPEDYNGVMGVPISFLSKYCPAQFEIVGTSDRGGDNQIDYLKNKDWKGLWDSPFVNGNKVYKRLLIKRKIKKFLIIGNGNAVTYKEIFPYIKNNQLWLGNKCFSGGIDFVAGQNYDSSKCKHPKYDDFGNIIINVMMCVWFTNIPHKKCNTPIDLYKKYNAAEYPKYDNYDAIEVSRVTDIPEDYNGVMGVPITFLDKYCPTQFQIVGTSDRGGDNKINYLKNNDWKGLWDSPFVNGNKVYKRLFIKRVKNNETKEI